MRLALLISFQFSYTFILNPKKTENTTVHRTELHRMRVTDLKLNSRGEKSRFAYYNSTNSS